MSTKCGSCTQMQMDSLPAEIVGDILSRIGDLRDVIRASATCRKLREAFRKHLHAVRADLDWHAYDNLTGTQLEMVMTKILFETIGLRDLSILMGDWHQFSTSTVVGWLIHSRKTLRQLDYDVWTDMNVDILDIFGNHKLEVLNLSNHDIVVVKLELHRFLCLRSLSLSDVTISASNLKLLVNACPRIESLELDELNFDMLDERNTAVELNSPTLKTLILHHIWVDNFLLKVDNIQYLQLEGCDFGVFKLMGKRSLKHFKIEWVTVFEDLSIGESVLDNLEILEVYDLTFDWPKFFQIISKSSKLWRLQLKYIDLENFATVDLERVAVCFPQLSHLSISCEGQPRRIKYDFTDCYSLKNLVILEIRGVDLDGNFSQWIEELLRMCLNLKKLIISGDISCNINEEECKTVADYNTSMVQLMKKYPHVDSQFMCGVKQRIPGSGILRRQVRGRCFFS